MVRVGSPRARTGAVLDAEEVEPLASVAQLDDPGPGLLGRQTELGQDEPEHGERPLRLGPIPPHHHQIVGAAHEHTAAARLTGWVGPVQLEVREQGRDDPALRRPRDAVSGPSPRRARARRSARSSFEEVPIGDPARAAAISRSCGIASKHEAMSVSTTQ